MNGSAKGSFWDRLRLRFRKIKLFFKKKKQQDEDILLEKQKIEKLKKQKEAQIIYNYEQNIKRSKSGLIIYTGHKYKKHYGITATKVALIPTTMILNAIKPSNSTQNKNRLNVKEKNTKVDETKNINLKQNNKVSQIKPEKNNTLSSNIATEKNLNKSNNEKVSIKQEKIVINVNKAKIREINKNQNRVNNGKKEETSNLLNYKTIDNKIQNKEVIPHFFAEPIITPKTPKVSKTIKGKKNKKGTIINIYDDKKLKDKPKLTKMNLYPIEKINNELQKKLEEQKLIYEEFNEKISKIKPEKITEVKFYFINNLFSNLKNIMLTAFSIPLLKRPKNIPLFSVGLFMINNSIRNMRKLITKEETISYIPSNNYINAIESNLNSIELINYMLEDSLDQIGALKSDYENQFGIYSYTDIYKQNMQKLNSYEEKIKKKQKQFEEEKLKMNKNLEKNQKILRLIRDMNN